MPKHTIWEHEWEVLPEDQQKKYSYLFTGVYEGISCRAYRNYEAYNKLLEEAKKSINSDTFGMSNVKRAMEDL